MDMDTVAEAARGGPTYTADEAHFVEALRAGDELAFVALIERYQPGMLRLARVFVRDVSVAEEVVQEAWLAVLRGLHRLEARSALKWWISSLLVNGAKTRATRERRSIPFSSVWDPGADPFDMASLVGLYAVAVRLGQLMGVSATDARVGSGSGVERCQDRQRQ